ncbi:MAG: TolC family protein [Phycisphaerales bacterium]|nr:MAG: TolC family protein [Phycisphaerales bacterium]
MQIRLGCFWMIPVCSALCSTACTDPLRRDDYAAYCDPPQRLHEAIAIRLEERSQSPPVSIEEAAADAARRTLAVQEPPESIEIELADVRAAALANNLDLKVELVNPSLAQQAVSEEQAQFEALLFGAIEHLDSDRRSTVINHPALQSQKTSYDTGVSIPLRTGGEVTVDFSIQRFDDQTRPVNRDDRSAEVIDPSYEAALRFSISQPLLRGAGIRTSTHAIRVAKYERDIAGAQTKLAAIRILANVDRAYWLLYAARRELKVSQEQYELALQQLDEARKRVEAGAAPEIEIMRAESGVAARLEAIIVADTQVRRRERTLKRIMNRDDLPMNSPTALILVTGPNPLGLDLDAEALADYAVEHRMEMLELELQLAIDASTIDFERNATLPLFLLDYTYDVNGLGGSLNESVRDVGDHAFTDHTLAFKAEIPIGNEAAKSRLRRAMLQRVQSLATQRQRQLAIRQEVFDAVDALEQDWQRILAARQEVILAGRTYEAEKRQFEVGLRTSTDVLEAAARLAGAQSREIRALSAYEISQIDIAFACGALIGEDRVIWETTTLK